MTTLNRHYGEMVVVMFLGMAVLGPPVDWALGAADSGWSELRDAPALMLLLMTFTMTAPMVAWMFAVMALRPHEYSGGHHHNQPVAA